MSSTASLELCKELYELSGWDDKDLYHDEGYISGALIPFYNLGYLLRKLPRYFEYKGQNIYLGLAPLSIIEDWNVGYHLSGGGNPKETLNIYTSKFERSAATPENAACKLTIELFKQGILSHE